MTHGPGYALSTGSSALDALLDGGVKSGATYDFFGESGGGKTQICFQLCVSAALSKTFEGKVIFVDTVGTFRPERVKEIALHKGVNPDSVLSGIDVFACRSVGEQMALLSRLLSLGENRVVLLLLDTISDNFLYEYHGDERIIQRQASLASHLLELAHFAVKMNSAIVFTNGLRADTLGGVREVAPSALDHGSHVKVMLRRERGGWFAEITRPRRQGRKRCEFRIGPEGVTDFLRSVKGKSVVENPGEEEEHYVGA